MTIRSGLSGTVPIFNDASRKRISSAGTPICPVSGLVSPMCPDFEAICPSLQPHAYASVAKNQLRFHMYIQKIHRRPGLRPGPRCGSSRRSPRHPSRTPDRSRLWRSHPTIRASGARPGLRCSIHGHLRNISPAYQWVVTVICHRVEVLKNN